jgi:hypothetical protein
MFGLLVVFGLNHNLPSLHISGFVLGYLAHLLSHPMMLLRIVSFNFGNSVNG